MFYQSFKKHADGGVVSFGRRTASIKTACSRFGCVEVRPMGSLTPVWLNGVFVTRAPMAPAPFLATVKRVQVHPRVPA